MDIMFTFGLICTLTIHLDTSLIPAWSTDCRPDSELCGIKAYSQIKAKFTKHEQGSESAWSFRHGRSARSRKAERLQRTVARRL